MTASQPRPPLDTTQKRFKGSLAGILVRTLLIFTFVPLALMAGAAYLRAQDLLRRQAVIQAQNLLSAQQEVIRREVSRKETHITKLLAEGTDFTVLMELAIHANPQSDEFGELRSGIIKEFNKPDEEGNSPPFDQFIVLDSTGKVKVASNASWEGQTLNLDLVKSLSVSGPTFTTIGFEQLYNQDQVVLVTVFPYKNASGAEIGTVIGITSPDNFKKMIQPFYGLYPFANTYFTVADKWVMSEDVSTGVETLGKPTDLQQKQIIPSIAAIRNSGESSSSTMDITLPSGDSALTVLHWIPELQMGTVLEIKYSAIYDEIGSLAPFTLTLAIFALIATAVVIAVGRNRVIKPLQTLSNTTRKFSEGDWSERASVTRHDEIGVLAAAFNQMADELSGLYHSLEDKVEERTRQVRTAAEVAQSITTLSNTDEMLNSTVELLVRQFGFYQASIFTIAADEKYLEFKTGYGAAAKGLRERKYRVEIGSSSIIGWVSENNMARVASDVSEDPLHLKNELLPETRSEATVPISIGKLVLGVLDVQSTRASSFTPETVAMLQTLASQLAVAFQNSRLSETNQINFDEIVRLYRSSKMIAEAKTEDEVFKIGEQILKDAPYSSVILSVGANNLVAMSASYVEPSSIYLELPKEVETNTDVIKEYLKSGPVLAEEHPVAPPISLMQYVEKMNLASSAYIPVKSGDVIVAVVILGSSQQTLSNLTIQPYASLVDVITATLGRIRAERQIERHVRELESLTSISEAVSSSHDLTSFFEMLYAKVRQTIGEYAITVALYNARNNTISIPFSFENGELLKIEPFPLGEGLTSILIHSRQPLLLVENTERRAAELGAMIRGKPAKSWMGVPLLVKNEPIGAMMLQDLENEFAFTEDDLKFLNTLAGQVAGAIQNVRLLEDSQRRAVQLETAAEIARDISGSLNLDELLIKAVNFIRERFDFYHAAVFLHDLPQEFAVIREATGEAGAQMKRAGYKIGIGSKSIVGYVTGRGEQLIVNDTMKDATYFANPFLPETRAEAAIPLKVGERILGALDVQSTQAYTFTDDNLRSLQILADQLAIAVVNTELFAETQEHLSQHRLLHHITTTVASGTTLEEALDSAVNGLQVTLGGDRVIIFLVDRERKKLEVKASVGYAEDVSKAEVLLGSGITGWVAQSRKPLRVKDVREDPRYVEISTNTKSELAIPLIYRNELLGVLNVESEQIDAYTENDEEMLGTLGGSLAAIIANARLLEQIRLQAERERLVNEVTSKIRRSTDIQSILTTTASELTRITGAVHTRIEIDPSKQD